MVILLKFILLAATLALSSSAWASSENYVPKNADVIFQTSSSNQSWAIMWATKSLYSHVGIIEAAGDGIYVVEAIGRVSRTRIKTWIGRGNLGRYSIYSPTHLSSDLRSLVVAKAKTYLGRPYDKYFNFDDAAIYCSELVYKAFQGIELSVGKVQKVKELLRPTNTAPVLGVQSQ
ncbi:MAG: YiiX/YebB-like N1pC/P60 family cysteine hydrolase [Proteobacteria bacterium]|nr:YiiX/YebB-like N1pC/P60 family cysteine hydrolase [Pseudomonadota bacterium]